MQNSETQLKIEKNFPSWRSLHLNLLQIVNSDLIRRAISNFNWDRSFVNTHVNEKVSIFTSTVLNILSNFIPHETIVCGYKDPPWFNKATKSLIQEKKTHLKNTAKATTTSSFYNA